ncbi:MAG: hypothetical protein MJ252_06815 [archaeon]|nr:hypothetical protein [archaeon]
MGCGGSKAAENKPDEAKKEEEEKKEEVAGGEAPQAEENRDGAPAEGEREGA